MNKTNFTPGPWTTTGSLVFRQVNPGGRKSYIADCSQDVGRDATIANARLIAAAPELVSSLELNVARLESALEALSQSQPGMPALPKAWREWFERQAKAVITSANIAISKAKRIQ